MGGTGGDDCHCSCDDGDDDSDSDSDGYCDDGDSGDGCDCDYGCDCKVDIECPHSGKYGYIEVGSCPVDGSECHADEGLRDLRSLAALR